MPSFAGPPSKFDKDVVDLVRRCEYFLHNLVGERAREGRKASVSGKRVAGSGGGDG